MPLIYIAETLGLTRMFEVHIEVINFSVNTNVMLMLSQFHLAKNSLQKCLMQDGILLIRFCSAYVQVYFSL